MFSMILNKKTLIHFLKQMRKRIQNGWCKKTFEKKINGKIHYCLLGAARQCYSRNIYESIEDYLNTKLSDKFKNVALFNDNCTRKSQVIKFLDECIKGESV